MYKAKKCIALILSIFMTFSLASCGDDNPVQASEQINAPVSEGNDIGQNENESETVAETDPRPSDEDTVEGLEMIPDPVESGIDEMISSMSTRQKLAQMMIIALRSDSNNSKTAKSITPEYAEKIREYDFGGIILFSGNMSDVDQTVNLIRDAQTAAMGSEPGIPMFICVDQEGGMINRISYGTTFPGNMALAATGNPEYARQSAALIGSEMAALGFNVDFAPVSDVNNNPANPIIGTRSFSDDPALTSQFVSAYVEGLDQSGIISSLKHFPGHGNVGEDSHTGLPSSDLDLEQLKTCELIPFKQGIGSGADMIMTAHIQFPNIETGTYTSIKDGRNITLPATLSRTIITGVLRNELKYDGVVITDAMDMGAIADNFNIVEASTLAINADVDILLCPVNLFGDKNSNTFSMIDNYLNSLEENVKNGIISESELDDSLRRILRLKIDSGIIDNTLSSSISDHLLYANTYIGCSDNHMSEWKITQEAMTLLKNENNALPLSGNTDDKTLILIPSEKRRPSVEYALKRLVCEGNMGAANTSIICYNGLTIYNNTLKNALNSSKNVVILSQSTDKNDLVCSIIDQVHASEGKKVILISLNLPYDVANYENADAVICAYNAYGSAYDFVGNGPFNLNLAVSICSAFGQSVPNGKLPVDIPKVSADSTGKIIYSDEIMYNRGSGLQNWGY